MIISWSGERSRAVASALRNFIPLVFQRAEVFTTADDIEKGARWTAEVSKELERADVAILCLTPEALNSPWMTFEAGALSKSLTPGRVIPLLVGLSVVDVSGPFTQFQACSAEKTGIHRLLSSLNSEFDLGLSDAMLNRLFEAMWPELDSQLQGIAAQATGKHRDAPKPRRSDRDLLEELMNEVRVLKRRITEIEKKA